MIEDLSGLHQIFGRSIERVRTFMDILSPAITNARDQHERLYYHHIYEEEEQRLGRLEQLTPKLSRYLGRGESIETTSFDFICLLQDLNLEKFGLHNFLEHLELALYHFTDEERSGKLNSMLDETKADYLSVKDTIARLNEQFLPSAKVPETAESDGHDVISAAHSAPDHHHEHHTKIRTPSTRTAAALPARKGLSVGSLRGLQ
jgi:hypothetical protein